jgi:hypothetical protein
LQWLTAELKVKNFNMISSGNAKVQFFASKRYFDGNQGVCGVAGNDPRIARKMNRSAQIWVDTTGRRNEVILAMD